MKNLNALRLENEWRMHWLEWVEGDLTARMVAERDKLRDIYKAGYLAGLRSLDGNSD